MTEIFKDLKVVELASVLAGPAVGLFFAELGANVIKIENKTTQGDVTRSWKLPSENQSSITSAYYQSINGGKTSIFLDLKNSEDYKIAIEHIKDADIVISNFKQGSAEKLKLDFDSLKQFNSRIIYGEITSYGENDPRPGFDVVMQAETGWISMTGSDDEHIAKIPVALIDILTAHQLKEGILIALIKRTTIPGPQKISVSLYDTSVASLANQGSNYLNANKVPSRIGTTHPNIAPYGDIVVTKDGKEIILSIGTQEQFVGLAKALEAENLKEKIEFTNNKSRVENRKMLIDQLHILFNKFDYHEITSRLIDNKVPHSPIKNLAEVFEDPKAKRLVYATNEEGIEVKRVKSVVFKMS